MHRYGIANKSGKEGCDECLFFPLSLLLPLPPSPHLSSPLSFVISSAISSFTFSKEQPLINSGCTRFSRVRRVGRGGFGGGGRYSDWQANSFLGEENLWEVLTCTDLCKLYRGFSFVLSEPTGGGGVQQYL